MAARHRLDRVVLGNPESNFQLQPPNERSGLRSRRLPPPDRAALSGVGLGPCVSRAGMLRDLRQRQRLTAHIRDTASQTRCRDVLRRAGRCADGPHHAPGVPRRAGETLRDRAAKRYPLALGWRKSIMRVVRSASECETAHQTQEDTGNAPHCLTLALSRRGPEARLLTPTALALPPVPLA